MVVGLLGNESLDSNRLILVTPKPANGVRLQATLGNQNPTGLPVGAVRENKVPIYYVIGENDEYYGSEPTKETYEEMYRLYKNEGLTDAQIDKLLVLDVKEHSYFTAGGITVEHGGGILFAQDDNIMGWLFAQEK